MCKGCRGGRFGGAEGGGKGIVRGGDVGGETVMPPPHAQHIAIESKPGMLKLPQV
jgi:hypothetical protein